LHDSVAGERVGTPSVSVITEQFVSAAELMATVLGAPGLPFVTVPHPISSASPDDLRATARAATATCVAALVHLGSDPK